MDAVMYLKEKARMTKKCSIFCNICPLFIDSGSHIKSCIYFQWEQPEKAVEIVEKWSKEHPQKTYLSDFLEKYPKAMLDVCDDTPCFCVKDLGYIAECPTFIDGHAATCHGCWNTPMEE